jgi:PAS domain S-box-containing protein
MPSLEDAKGPLRVITMPPTLRDGEIAAGLLREHGVDTIVCKSMHHLCGELESGAGMLLVAEEHLLADTHGVLSDALSNQEPWSDLPLVVLTLPHQTELQRLRDWQEVANVTLLPRPLRIEQFHGVVRSCLRDRRRQYVVRRLLERLHDRGRDLRQLADAMPQMVFVVDSVGNVEFLNQRAVDYLGLQRNRPGGLLSSIGIHEDDFERIERAWVNAIASRELLQCEFRVRNRLTGEYRWQLARGEPAMGGDGSISRWYVTCTDIHDRKLAEQQLAAAYERADAASLAKSEFLANMSHEIRTPMTAILGYGELLAGRESDPEKAKYLEVIRQNGGFLLDIINDILDLSKIEAGKVDIAFDAVPIRSVVADLHSLFATRAQDKGISFHTEVEVSTPLAILTDSKRLRQILVNLIGNAIKFTDSGHVMLSVSQGEGRLRFAVRDTGIGIPPEQLARIFQPFHQADASGSRQFGGTGLGLAISRRLATMLDGEIRVESAEGKGSEFVLDMVAAEVSPEEAVELSLHDHPVASSAEVRLASRKVLVVDDRRDVRFLTGHILTDAGAVVEFAEDGVQATEVIRRMMAEGSTPDLVLMDMQMPKMDGYQATEELRAMGFAPPIIALTADAMHGDMRRCLDCGCNAYLSKPIDTAKLLQTVSQLLGSTARPPAALTPANE